MEINSEINAVPFCFEKVSEGFLSWWCEKTGFNNYVYDFSVYYDATAVDDILSIHKIKKNDTK